MRRRKRQPFAGAHLQGRNRFVRRAQRLRRGGIGGGAAVPALLSRGEKIFERPFAAAVFQRSSPIGRIKSHRPSRRQRPHRRPPINLRLKTRAPSVAMRARVRAKTAAGKIVGASHRRRNPQAERIPIQFIGIQPHRRQHFGKQRLAFGRINPLLRGFGAAQKFPPVKSAVRMRRIVGVKTFAADGLCFFQQSPRRRRRRKQQQPAAKRTAAYLRRRERPGNRVKRHPRLHCGIIMRRAVPPERFELPTN